MYNQKIYMNRKNILLLLILVLFAIVHVDAQKVKKEIAIKEIIAAETAFEKMAAEKGLAQAFWFFADDNAVIKRGNDSLIRGRDNIRHFYSRELFTKASIKWAPDFVDVSESGDMGYTYGKYLWQLKTDDGKLNESRGVFHTVWKKQHNGEWKFVWD